MLGAAIRRTSRTADPVRAPRNKQGCLDRALCSQGSSALQRTPASDVTTERLKSGSTATVWGVQKFQRTLTAIIHEALLLPSLARAPTREESLTGRILHPGQCVMIGPVLSSGL
ncbi:hypothetical protein BD309DRAFT_959684 [Dichomitus squalens]|uniref:Uncharacterized protein n=1 Tax=Dichomitus squalens TaxID=114155 RepID=A0A4Q9NQP1_9APHY|nr:hypothetical protein BD309DRAFT_959684 [Dichomitus squalens]TBU56684.1 hypothetical protein BD310DRAFT_600315 [Dichomitus squalens]